MKNKHENSVFKLFMNFHALKISAYTVSLHSVIITVYI